MMKMVEGSGESQVQSVVEDDDDMHWLKSLHRSLNKLGDVPKEEVKSKFHTILCEYRKGNEVDLSIQRFQKESASNTQSLPSLAVMNDVPSQNVAEPSNTETSNVLGQANRFLNNASNIFGPGAPFQRNVNDRSAFNVYDELSQY